MTEGNRTIEPDNTRVEIISVHVPKTAGTTFKKVLQQVYAEEEIFFDYPHRGKLRNRMLTQNSANVKVIHGHFPANKYDVKFPKARKIIWLRNPIIRLISHYFFWKSWQVLISDEGDMGAANLNIIDFAERPEMRNTLAENYLKNQSLADFYFVGLQEFFQEDVTQLSKMLNWPQVESEPKNKNPYPEYDALLKELLSQKEVVDKITTLNKEDIELYREALKLREKRTKRANLSPSKNLRQPWKKEESEASKKRPNIEPVLSWGFIDKAAVENQILSLSGWAASRNKGPLEGFKVVVGDREYSFFEQLLGIPSPDVENLHPTLDSVGAARFRLRILQDKQQIQQLSQCAIALTPIFSGREGIILLKTISPILPPPKREHLNIVGISNIEELNRRSLKLTGQLLQRAGLLPTDRILELGCNMGLTAYSLVHYLKPTGSYEGFDFAEGPISWARQYITATKPNFRFLWENVCHPLYNPRGTLSPTEILLPYPDGYFDCVCIPYLFTHLPPPAIRHYFQQITKVLKPGGRCLFACYLLNSESQQLIAEGRSSHNLIYELEDCFSSDKHLPETAIGFREPLLLKWIDEAGFILLQKSYGAWCGRASFSGPDVLILINN
jgi:SAM-dependent methyltransferase